MNEALTQLAASLRISEEGMSEVVQCLGTNGFVVVKTEFLKCLLQPIFKQEVDKVITEIVVSAHEYS